MSGIRHVVPIFATLMLTVAACGGGAGGTTSGSTDAAAQSQAAASAPSQAAADVPASDAASSAAAPQEPASAGGGSGVGVCDLATTDELAGMLGQGVATSVIAGPPDTCDIQSTDGAPLAAMTLTNMTGVSASFVFDAFAGSPTAQSIQGIGEKASYDPSQGALLVLKNGAILTIAVFDDGSGSTDEAVRLDLMKQIGATAAGRM